MSYYCLFVPSLFVLTNIIHVFHMIDYENLDAAANPRRSICGKKEYRKWLEKGKEEHSA